MKRLLIIPLLLISLLASADKWYIATTGSDTHGKGTLADPWRTLKHACDTVTGANFMGDTIVVGAGTFTETAQSSLGVGVSLYGAGATSIITTSAALNPIIWLYSDAEGTDGNQSISYVRFDGNATTALRAILVNARSNVRVHHCEFEDFLDYAVVFEGAVSSGDEPTVDATGNEFHDNTTDNCSKYSGSGTSHLSHTGQSGFLIYGNTMTQTSRAAGQNGYLIKGRYNTGLKIYNNTLERKVDNQPYHFLIEYWDCKGGAEIYDNTLIGGAVDVGGYYSVKGSYAYSYDIHDNQFSLNKTDTKNTADYPVWAVVVEGGAEDVRVHHNYMKNFNYPIGISVLQALTTAQRNYFYYNIIHNWGNSATGHGAAVQVGADEDDGVMQYFYFYNNVFYNDGVGVDPYYVIWFNATGGVFDYWYFINNIFIGGADFFFRTQSNSGTPSFDHLTIRYNIQYGNGYSNEPYYDASFTPSNITYNNAVKSNPLFKSNETFRLRPTSPCIDAGTDVSLTNDYWGHRVPQNSIPDIGACEYGNYVLFYNGKQLY